MIIAPVRRVRLENYISNTSRLDEVNGSATSVITTNNASNKAQQILAIILNANIGPEL